MFKEDEKKKRRKGIGNREVVKKTLPNDITIFTSQVSINQQLPEPPLSETA